MGAFMNFLEKTAFTFASLAGLGRLPIPGTWGSAAAAVFAPWLFMSATCPVRVFILVLVFVGGGLACDIVERQTQTKDPGLCIIDEVLGQWVTYLAFASLSPWRLFWGFVLFRIFDIWKPWPIRASEDWLPGGFGVMIDDLLAGIYAALVLGAGIGVGLL
jgi:phosphatidylglycerophosphatase A